MSGDIVKIGLISDTHVPKRAPCIPSAALRALEGVDMIIHAGDATVMSALDSLSGIAPLKAVCGNMDEFRGAGILPDKLIVPAGGRRIGVIHGWGSPVGLRGRALKAFENDRVDCVVFGHSHRPGVTREGGVLMVNPGSPTDRLFSPFLSVATLTIGEEIEAKIIRL